MAGSEFSHKDRGVIIEGRLSLASQLTSMRSCVEVKGIHDVSSVDLIRTCYVYILAPCRSSDDDDSIVVVVTYSFDNVCGIVLDITPADSVWLITNFVEHVSFLSMFLRHVFPEFDGVILVCVWISWVQHVPVDKTVDSSLSAVINITVDPLSPSARVGDITLLFHIHGKTEDRDSPVFYKDIQ